MSHSTIAQILWTGWENQSVEFCNLVKKPTDIEVNGSIISSYSGEFCKVEYSIFLNPDWTVSAFTLEAQFSQEPVNWYLNAEKGHGWTIAHHDAEPFKDCIDIDISFTPFTNSLPVNRLHMKEGDTADIQVLYIDIMERKLKPVNQRYTRLPALQYKFENVPNDFEAVLELDENGLVVNYPDLYKRRGYRLYT